MVLRHALQAFLIAGVVAPFSYYAGLAARRLRLPQITGYLVSGMVCGPYVLGILTQESVSDLNIIEGACLGIIGLAAGAELQLSELYRSKKQVVSLTGGICVLTWLLCYFTIRWSASLTPVLHVNSGQLGAIAALGATLMMARSPASAIAVLKEMDAKGPFVSLVMGVVVLKDVVVIVAFALTMELVPMIIDPSSSGLGLSHLLLPLLSVCVSLSAGLLGGSLISLALGHQVHVRLAGLVSGVSLMEGHHHHPPSAVAYRCKQAVVLLLSTAVFSITRSLEAEPLLACVTSGMLLANKRPSGPGVSELSHDELTGLINSIMSTTNVAFFGLAGASLKLSAIAESVWVALVVFGVRLVAIMGGSWLGSRAGGVKSELQRRCFWMSMVTQAGVAMGLARIAGTAFSDWGPSFQTVMMAVIMINMLLGPPLFRTALIQVGEARAHSLPLGQQPQQLHRDSSAGAADVPVASSLLPHDGRKSPHSAHNSSSSSAAAAAGGSSSVDKGDGGSSPWAQRTHSMQQPRLHLASEHGSPGAGAAPSGGGVGSRAAAKGGLLDPGGGEDESHHVVMSSGALLHHLGANSHQRSSAD